MNTENQSLFLEISDPFLGRKFIDECNHLIDEFTTLPVVNIPYLEGNLMKVLTIGCKTSEFNDLIECVSFIKKIRIDNFFYIYSINTGDGKVRLRYIDISLDMRIPGLIQIRTQRIRDKKINEILK
jgi:hypothetical protein